jgi:hypothetical protein
MLPVACTQAWPGIPQPSYMRPFGLSEADSRFALSMLGESFLPGVCQNQRTDFKETRPGMGCIRAFPAVQSSWAESFSLDDVASLVWPNVYFNLKPLGGQSTSDSSLASSPSGRSQESGHGDTKESNFFSLSHHSICFPNHGCSLQAQEPPKRRPMKKIVLTSEKACEVIDSTIPCSSISTQRCETPGLTLRDHSQIYSFKADADGSSGSNESIAVRSQHIAARSPPRPAIADNAPCTHPLSHPPPCTRYTLDSPTRMARRE